VAVYIDNSIVTMLNYHRAQRWF